MQPQEIILHKGVTIEIHQDTDAQSPSEWGDTDLFLVANHRQCYIPEPGEKRITNDAQELVDRWKDTHWIFPLEAYIHSGVVLALSREGNFPDRQWDVSRLGFVFCAKKEWRFRKSARKAALSLINEWNEYLSGDVWGYVVDPDGLNEESCWGFYGFDYCVGEAKSVAEYVAKKKVEEAKEVQTMACRDIVTV